MKDKLTQITMRKYLQERKQTPGFIRRMKSSLERWQMKLQSEWAEQERKAAAMADEALRRVAEKKAEYERKVERREAILVKARELIEWSNTEYETAKARHKYNIKTFTELTLNWTSQRVLSTHQHFYKLCDALYNDNALWVRLSRDERRFISDAFKMLKAEERASIAGSFIAAAVA